VTLRARIWTLLLVAVVLAVAAGIAVRAGYVNVTRTTNQVTNQLQPASDAVASLNNALSEMDSGVTAYALTGDSTDLSTYVEGSARASAAFTTLRPLLADDEELARLLRETRSATATWRRQGTRPIVNATRDGDRAAARDLVRSGTSRNLYSDARAFTNSLDEQIRDAVDEVVAQQEDEFIGLSFLLNLTALVTLGLLAVLTLLLLRGVLRPLKDLQSQMLGVAQEGQHETPIVASGPPELRAVGQDAERMRRELVTEIDRARQAHEGLEQQTPVVAAIRAELADSHTTQAVGIDLAGEQQPAEGVMAGDWWSVQELLKGQVAITVTDVSGHGPEAGMEALRLKHIIELSLAQSGDPALALKAAAEGFRSASRFATSLIVIIEPESGFLTWANAGHPPAWMVGEASITELVTTGPLLSVLGGAWTNQHSHLDIGSWLLMWTDGLTESHDAQDNELGDGGLTELIEDALASEQTSAGIVAHLLSAARARSVDWRRDDVTLIAARRV
jgi:sigma-B regulation protein RsbU (phosphoserine phosphatase)